jgi:rare lipoprotein A (peptidoglycan hydrolase)
MLKYSNLACFAVLAVAACQAPPAPVATAPAAPAPVETAAAPLIESGTASYYGTRHNGRRTANGDVFNMWAMTAAHPWLPFGTKVRVTIAGTDRSVDVTITDRLPSRRRVIDLSQGAAKELGILRQGVAEVTLSRL